jgi:hypothetical protein
VAASIGVFESRSGDWRDLDEVLEELELLFGDMSLEAR